MTPDEYLQALRKKLKSFSAADQANLVEEIGSHIESGEEDPTLGKDSAQRRQKLMSELGSPEKMAKGFKIIYQPDGLIDFLLVAIPLLLNTSLNLLLVSLMPRYPWADVRAVVLIRVLLIGIGIWRGSKLLTLAWATRTVVQIVAMLALTQGYYLHQSIIWIPILLGVVYLTGRLIWQNRRDALIVIYGLLPLIVGGLGFAFNSTVNVQFLNGRIELSILQAFSRFSVILDGLNIVALAVIFLAKDRNFRWAAVAIYGLILGSWIAGSLEVLFTWVVVPLLIVCLGWWLDQFTRRQIRFAR
ncbi:MAG: hypothetical protein ABSA23_13765 [Anaerolineales bacterium]|jgi:hypothetical protein